MRSYRRLTKRESQAVNSARRAIKRMELVEEEAEYFEEGIFQIARGVREGTMDSHSALLTIGYFAGLLDAEKRGIASVMIGRKQ